MKTAPPPSVSPIIQSAAAKIKAVAADPANRPPRREFRRVGEIAESILTGQSKTNPLPSQRASLPTVTMKLAAYQDSDSDPTIRQRRRWKRAQEKRTARLLATISGDDHCRLNNAIEDRSKSTSAAIIARFAALILEKREPIQIHEELLRR